MAGVAYYNTGTATATVGSKTVTGTGTNWLSTVGGLTAIKAGDKFGIHVGRPIIIASVDSNTQLTLEDNWPGPAQTNAAYRIELTSPDVIAVEALRRMLGSLSSGVLYGLSQLPSTPSKALTIDENGSAALADMGATGKSLLAALSSSAAYGVLGEIPNAQLPTRLRELSTTVTDADTVLANGRYAVASTALNIPEAAAGVLTVDMFSSNVGAVQTYTRLSTTATGFWLRVRGSSTWSSWYRIPLGGSDSILLDAYLPPRIRGYPPAGASVTDANSATEFGLFRIASTGSNIPVAQTGLLFSVPFDANSGHQMYMRGANTEIWFRRRSGGTWAAWTRIDGDLSGPGAAVANNAIVGFNGTTGFLTKALTTLEALANLGPVLGGVAPEPAAAGVGMANGDFDTVIFPGVYTLAGQWTNGPNGAAASGYVGILEVQARSYNNLYVQIVRLNNGAVHKRYGGSGPAWNAWGITEGDVSGPAVSVDGAFAQFSGTTGKVLKAASIATATILGRSSSGAGAVEQLTAAQARSVMSVPSVAEMNALVTTARQVRLGAEASISTTASAWNKATNSAVLTGMYLGSGFTVNNIAYRTVQQTDLSGNWVAVAQV